jgi:hypothetical protein
VNKILYDKLKVVTANVANDLLNESDDDSFMSTVMSATSNIDQDTIAMMTMVMVVM